MGIMKRIRRLIFILIGIFAFATIVLIVVSALPFLIPHPHVRFLNALLTGDEYVAQQYLSPELKNIAESQCPGGRITACAANLISPEWGEFEEEIVFILGSASPVARLFYARWSESWEPIAIVVLHASEDDNTVIGWRGFVPVEDENAAVDLLRGVRMDNHFP